MGKAKRGRPVGKSAANKNLGAPDETFIVKHNSPSPEISPPPPVNTKASPSMPAKVSPLVLGSDTPETSDSDSGLDDPGKGNSSMSDGEKHLEEEAPHKETVTTKQSDDSEDDMVAHKDKEVPKRKIVKEREVPMRKAAKELQEAESDDSEVFDEDEIDHEPKAGKSSNSGTKDVKANLAKVMKAKGRDKKVSKKPMAKAGKGPATVKRQLMLDVILEGLSKMDERKGVSMPSIRKYVMENEVASNKSWERLRPKVRLALESGIEDDLIVRPKGSESVSGLTGFFKINKKKYTGNPVEKAEEKAAKTLKMAAISTENLKSLKESKTQGKKAIPKSPVATKTTQKPKPTKKPTKELVKETETKAKKKPGAKAKHRRSISEDEIISLPKKGAKKITKSKSLEQLAPAPKKTKSKK